MTETQQKQRKREFVNRKRRQKRAVVRFLESTDCEDEDAEIRKLTSEASYYFTWNKTCPYCNGDGDEDIGEYGKSEVVPCWRCDGKGQVSPTL